MAKCIYCCQEKSPRSFNREHVLPAAFGSFEQSLVLHDSVCSECNSGFGSSIDLVLARGTEEGLRRYFHGVRPAAAISGFRYDAVSFSYSGEDDYKGALLRLIPDPEAEGSLRGEPIDQVGFARADGQGFVWLPLNELYAGDWKSRADLDWKKGIKIYARDLEEVRRYLDAEGVSIANWRPLVRASSEDEEVAVHSVQELTVDVQRVMAKICFNYLTFVHGTKFVLDARFDEVRQFIRWGDEPGYPVVRADATEIVRMPTEYPDGMRPAVHIIVLERPINADVVLGQVSLFGGFRYEVVLSLESVPDLVYSGHVYNPADRRVYELRNRRQG